MFLEYSALSGTDWNPLGTGSPFFLNFDSWWNPTVLLIVYVISRFTFYLLTAVVMKLSGATLVNLSLLTTDFYCLLAGICLFQYKVCSKVCH